MLQNSSFKTEHVSFRNLAKFQSVTEQHFITTLSNISLSYSELPESNKKKLSLKSDTSAPNQI